jgi:urease accessory protein
VEAGTAVVSRHFCLTEPTLSLLAVESAWAARTPSKAARAVSRALGRGYLRLTEQLWHLPPSVLALRENGGQLSRAVILGAVAAVAGLDAQSLVRLVVYDDAQTIASALLKLEPLDPLRPQRWVLRACAAAEPHVPALADLTSPDAIPAFGTPQIEEWTEAHSRLTQRLFRA